MSADQVNALKEKGNAAVKADKFAEAIQFYSEAIALAPTNEVLYSNRAAAYISMKNFDKAIEDGNKAVELKPQWSKGYSRQAQALYFAQRYAEAKASYEKGLEVDPTNESYKKGIEDCNAALADEEDVGGAAGGLGKMFGPDMLTKLQADPRTRGFFSQPDYVTMMTNLQRNPQMMNAYMKDPRFMQSLSVLLGVDISGAGPGMGGEDGAPAPETAAAKPAAKAAAAPAPEPELTADEREEKRVKEEAVKEKERANGLYQAKKFDEALAAYDRAIEMDSDNISFLLNKSACLFEMGRLDDCVNLCNEIVDTGRRKRADFKVIAKALARAGNALAKKGQTEEAIKMLRQSLVEHRVPDVLKRVQELEKKVEEEKRKQYEDPAKGEEAKNAGNEAFKKGDFPAAVKHYEEAIKRDPRNHVYYSNRAGAYTKLGALPEALRDCDKCLEIAPTFVKAWTRKGTIHFLMKDYHKCLEDYAKALEIEPENQEALDGQKRTMTAIGSMSAEDEETARQRALQDPEVQDILRDPAFQQILDQMQNTPGAAQKFLNDPIIAPKINKLIAAGVLKMGSR